MNIKNSRAVFGMMIIVPVSMLFLLSFIAPDSAESIRIYAANPSCEKQKAILHRLEKTRPGKKFTKKQIFN